MGRWRRRRSPGDPGRPRRADPGRRRRGADRLAELAHGLAYWAARWQPVPGAPATEPRRVTARPATGESDPPSGPRAAEETFARAVAHGDEHVIKFADTA